MSKHMTKQTKKRDFLIDVPRLLTTGPIKDIEDLIPFYDFFYGEDLFSYPSFWSEQSATTFFDQAGHKAVPVKCCMIEENSTPSWLWRHKSESTKLKKETSAREIVDRVAGSSVYATWQLGGFKDEEVAQSFYDELRVMLLSRYVTIDFSFMETAGADWAYGLDHKKFAPIKTKPTLRAHDGHVILSNAQIDRLIKDKKTTNAQMLRAEFSDITAERSFPHSSIPPRALIDLMALRNSEGVIDVEKLTHVVRLTTLVMGLQNQATDAIGIGFVNLASVLMAQGIAYDSSTARSIASSITAIITATAFKTSAEISGLKGQSTAFTEHRPQLMRALRNQRRVVYGEDTDYEGLSVLPSPVRLGHAVDLHLISKARAAWDDVMPMVEANGLALTYVTDLTPAPQLAHFLGALTQGMEPLPSLKQIIPSDDEEDYATPSVVPAFKEALYQLGYDAGQRKDILSALEGTQALSQELRGFLVNRGLDEDSLDQIEAYISKVNDIRLAVTPWIIGIENCKTLLGIKSAKADSLGPRLLETLGFSASSIEQANACIYGVDSIPADKLKSPADRKIMATAAQTTIEARLSMAAAVQGVISGDVGLSLPEAGTQDWDNQSSLIIRAWRYGLKSIALERDQTQASPKMIPRRIALHAHSQRDGIQVPRPQRKLLSSKKGSEAKNRPDTEVFKKTSPEKHR